MIVILDPLRARLRSGAQTLRSAGVDVDVDVEDKSFSIALHYRLAPVRHEALDAIDTVPATPCGKLKVFGGKMVINVLPADAPDKADAVTSLVQRCGSAAVVFVGDDANDEVVFERAEPHWLTIRVGRRPASRARFCLDSMAAVNECGQHGFAARANSRRLGFAQPLPGPR